MRIIKLKLDTLLLFIALLNGLNYVQGQNRFNTIPDSAIIHTEDISLFWTVFDQSSPKFNGENFQILYLDSGSDGLKGFIKMRIESGKILSKIVKKNLSYYQQIRQSSLSISSKKDILYGYFSALKKLYPSAVFPDVYFVIGALNTGGTTFKGGLIIGAEMFGEETATFKPRLNIELANLIVVHELIHFQQNYVKDNSLLAQSIKEGAADFICELITGSHSNKPIYQYGNDHEGELWEEFKKDMHETNWTPWLYYTKDKTRPKDLGYWMGYKIVRAYFENSINKEEAIYNMLNINNFSEFLTKSGYNGKQN
jgi:hypothetical protein